MYVSTSVGTVKNVRTDKSYEPYDTDTKRGCDECSVPWHKKRLETTLQAQSTLPMTRFQQRLTTSYAFRQRAAGIARQISHARTRMTRV